MVAAETRLNTASQLHAPSFGLVRTTQWKKIQNFNWVDQTSTSVLMTREIFFQENGGLADQWCVHDGDIFCQPILVPSFLKAFDVANDKFGTGPQKTEVIYYLANLDAALPERKVGEVRLLDSVSTVVTGSNTLGVALGPRQFIADQLLAKADVIRACPAVSRPADRICSPP